jgi:Flp pilus assembly protein TadD
MNQSSGRLYLLRADLDLMNGNFAHSLRDYKKARELKADQRQVESGYAFALQNNGAPIDDCIAAFRTAISFAPQTEERN